MKKTKPRIGDFRIVETRSFLSGKPKYRAEMRTGFLFLRGWAVITVLAQNSWEEAEQAIATYKHPYKKADYQVLRVPA